MFAKPKNRYTAFGIHVLISALIFIVLCAIIVFVWYPGFMFKYDGGWQGVRLIAGVDFVIGPLLTLLVYNVKKPELKRDLLIIALIQLSALAYGCWLVYQERPVAVVYADGTVRVLSGGSFLDEEYEPAKKRLKEIGFAPVWVYVDLPEEEEARRKARANQLVDGTFHTRFDLYKPLNNQTDILKKEALKADESGKYESELADAGDNLLFRFKTRYAFGLLELDAKTLDYVQTRDVNYGFTLQ